MRACVRACVRAYVCKGIRCGHKVILLFKETNSTIYYKSAYCWLRLIVCVLIAEQLCLTKPKSCVWLRASVIAIVIFLVLQRSK